MNAIEGSKRNNLDKLIFGLGIRNIGDKTAALLGEHFGSMDALRQATAEQMCEIDGFGEVMAQSVLEFFAKDGTTDLLNRLARDGVNMHDARRRHRAGRYDACRHGHATDTLPSGGRGAHHPERRQGGWLGQQKDELCCGR